MKLENMNRDFPKMPEEMRQMIEQEVEKQLAKPDMLPGNRKTGRHISKKRLAIAVAAATLALGTTVFAGVLYGLKNNRVGKYAYETKLELRNDISMPADYYETSSGEYAARCRVLEKDSVLIDLTLTVPVREQAEAICSHWRDKSQEIYASLMKALL